MQGVRPTKAIRINAGANKIARLQDRTKKLHRLLTILRKIDNRERCTPQALAQEFGTTERNIFRDINDLMS